MTGSAVLDVDLGAIIANYRLLCQRHPGGPVAGVVKADAYGLGAAHVAPALLSAGCQHFFVAHLKEALALRSFLPGPMIAVLNGLPPGAADAFAADDITPVLNSLTEVASWSAQAKRLQRALPALLHIDTGMNRLGLPADELDLLVAEPERLNGINLLFIMTHLVSAELPGDPVNEQQYQAFAAACGRLPPAPRSLANASGTFLGFGSDLARPGAALYGLNPQPGRPNPLNNVVRLRAPILQVRHVPAGARVGYNGAWTAQRPSRIATVPLGYADGLPRALHGASARFDGRAVPLVGRVSMDLTTYDVTDAPAARLGDCLELIGPDNPVDQLAAQAGTTGYEILTGLGPRLQRRYA